MFTINYVSATENKVVKEEHTLEDAKRFCNEWTEGRKQTTDDGDDWCKLVVCEIVREGDRAVVFETKFFKA